MQWPDSSNEVAWEKLSGVLFVLIVLACVVCPLARQVFFPPSALTHDDPNIMQLAMRLHSERDYVWDMNGCPQAWNQNKTCIILTAIDPITKSQWQQLFPQMEFYLLRIGWLEKDYERGVDGYGMGNGPLIIAAQGGQLYETASAFPDLLKINDVLISDSNRDMIAQAFALMTLPDYLQDEITFSDSKAIDEPGIFSFERFNYTITTRTKLHGLKIVYLFFFQDEHLKIATWNTTEYDPGRYVGGPFTMLSPAQQGELRFP